MVRSFRWLGALAVALLFGVLLALAYRPAWKAPFIFDDDPGIVENTTIRHWSTALNPPPDTTASGRPILNLSFAVNYAASGFNVSAFRATNFAIHCAGALLLMGFFVRTLRLPAWRRAVGGSEAIDGWIAGAAALLWLLHPLQTESVAYVVQRAESLMGLFYLLTLYCFARAVTPGSRTSRWLVAAVAACLLGMGTKEVMASAPILVFLYDSWFVSGTFGEAWRRRRGFYLALAATWIPQGWLVLHTGQRSGTVGFSVGIPWSHYLVSQFPALTRYTALSFWPRPLVFDYGPMWGVRAHATLPQIGLVLGLLGVIGWAACRRSVWGWLGLWFLAILAPTSLVPAARQSIAEHRMYLALAPLAFAAAVLLFRWLGRPALALCAAWAVLLGVMTHTRAEDYQTRLRMWEDVLAKLPDNAFAHAAVGRELAAHGRLDEALPHFLEARRLRPDLEEIEDDVFAALTKLGRADEALPQLHREVALDPGDARAQATLGVALADVGKPVDALDHYRRALAINPNDARTEDNLGLSLAATGQPAEAIAHFQRSLELDPVFGKAEYDWGVVLMHQNRFDDAIGHYRTALALDPTRIEAQTNWAIALDRSGHRSEAIEHFRAATELRPQSATLHRNLGLALQAAGRKQEAAVEFETMRKLEAPK